MEGKYKFVWPKDGPKGNRPRGFFRKFNDIVTGKGPDIFVQRKASVTPITADRWGNWDTYHDPIRHRKEEINGARNLFTTSRGFKRYDPHTRRYRDWFTPQDWYGVWSGTAGMKFDGFGFPKFTRSEAEKIILRHARGKRVKPYRMGKEWDHDGPKRFRQNQDWFWQEAHRTCVNEMMGLPRHGPHNPFFRMHQNMPDDLIDWMQDEIYY